MKKPHILFFLGHPAHYHMFKNTISALNDLNYRVTIMVKSKDILTDLLDAAGITYINSLPKGRKDGLIGITSSLIKKTKVLYQFCRKNKPNLMLGTAAEIAWVGSLLRITSLVFNEDDYNVVKGFGRLVYPFANAIVSPESCNNGRWNRKTIQYAGYQKLAYLHPNRFQPLESVILKYFDVNVPYSILRFAKLNAYHDTGAEGFTTETARETIKILKQFGKVYISSEKPLEPEFETYRLNINPLDIHHILYYAQLYVGDSQSMAVEAAMLGTPSLRFSSFAGKIRVLEELENKYQLTFGILPSKKHELFSKINEILTQKESKEFFKARKDNMLKDKVDVTQFFIDTINQNLKP